MVAIFNKKTHILDTDLLEGLVDIHSHILPGVDDGVQSLEEAQMALEFLSEIGVSKMFLTPHIMEEYPQNDTSSFQVEFYEFSYNCNTNIQLQLAAEYMIDSNFNSHLRKGLLSMNNRHVLVETSFLSPPLNITKLLYSIKLEGYNPIMAHPERFRYMTTRDLQSLKDRNCKFQLNLLSLSGCYGNSAQSRAEELLKNEFYDFIGTDFHNLETFRRELKKLSLTSVQINKLQRLVENNHMLW